MANNSIRLVAMGDSSDDSEEKYEIYEAGSDMLCVIGLENSQTSSKPTRLKPKYKQSYREAWESMRDFKGWLTSVPGNNTKAYCKLCKKELHCHRLSLLKHKVTFKHHKKEEEQKLMLLFEDKNDTNIKKASETKEEEADSDVANVKSVPVVNDEVKNTVPESNSPVKKIVKTEATQETQKNQENGEDVQLIVGSLSTHVLDISKGVPGAGVHVVLYKLIEGRWTLLSEGLTGTDGHYDNFLTNQSDLSPGRYKLHFDVDKYFEKLNQETIFPFIEIVFDIKDVTTNYHIPLLLSPFGYSVYRGN